MGCGFPSFEEAVIRLLHSQIRSPLRVERHRYTYNRQVTSGACLSIQYEGVLYARSQCDAPCGIGLQPCSHGVLSVSVNIFLLLEFDTAT